MQAEIVRFHSPDVDDLEGYTPLNRYNFAILLQMIIGIKGGEGEESFDVIVCTPQWLEEECGKNGYIVGRHHLIVSSFSYLDITTYLKQCVDRLEEENWNQLAEKIGRIGKWEFEDYDVIV